MQKAWTGEKVVFKKKKIMITKNNKFKCDECGYFISYKNFDEGKAIHMMVLPDSDYSYETWDTVCKNCLGKREKNGYKNS